MLGPVARVDPAALGGREDRVGLAVALVVRRGLWFRLDHWR